MENENVNNVNAQPVDIAPAAVDKCLDCDAQACAGACACSGCHSRGRSNLHSYDWLADVPGNDTATDLVEVHFKNTRRGFYRNSQGVNLKQGDLVAVETTTGGHDVGTVALTGRLVKLQMQRANLKPDVEILRVFRKAKPADLERFAAAKAREVDTMIRSRKIAADLHLKMKIGDVEYQGDGSKAIFYYIADERVDFRQLIKVLADVFKIRIEMKQIGARQEAGRIGGMGPCGRPLCCASWMTKFVSVSTGAARVQDVSLNPQKLAGQCAKLKCCINFEVDSYVEISRTLPPRDTVLETIDGSYFIFKTDTLKREMTFSTDKRMAANLVTIPVERVWAVIEMNKNGEKPEKLSGLPDQPAERSAYADLVGQDSINRFDKKKKRRKKKGGKAQGDKPSPKADEKPRKAQGDKQSPKAQNDKQSPKADDKPRKSHADRPQRNRRNDRSRKDGGRNPKGGNGKQKQAES